MPTIDQLVKQLDLFAPPELAESWDNVGLLVGDRQRQAERVMTCLTLTENVAAEAVEQQADLIVTHHPLPFRPLQRLTTDSPEGRVLWQIAGAGISVYSPHTAFDSAAEGINQQLAQGLSLTEIAPLAPSESTPAAGTGRLGVVAPSTTLRQLASETCKLLGIDHLRWVGADDRAVGRVAVACGSGGSMIDLAMERGADTLVTGEATFHSLLAAESAGVALLLVGHYASERFAVEWLSRWLGQQFSGIKTWPSGSEHDPLRLFTGS